MPNLSKEQFNKSKEFIYKNGRLLERKLFEHFFEDMPRQACLNALLAYQNPDGGFGNGIEPDLLCPDSTAIGAETAMYIMDTLDYDDPELIRKLVDWIVNNQNDEGFIKHPPENMANYPFQPWWENPDSERVFVLTGLLKKWGVDLPKFYQKVRSFYLQSELPEEGSFYSYPYYVYLKYCSENNEDKARLDKLVAQLPVVLDKHKSHFPLFSRYWFYAKDYVPRDVLENEAQAFINALQEDGGLETPYPDLPWWRPIFTLDGLILLKKWSFF
ncbi:MAG: terpene cyclase/mutase family protein [Anaerolineales bacterium]|nr:terpene cyclase/mutase family protein [Anaerolineales bacterium]MCK5315723.1 terpene cyclase/mutase family protein [Anaerolineales bacterium]MCK5429727.1 terpene cyclase/mutase family protein [Anaerolineales bacterium]